MGYELHITRKANWFDDGPDIPEAEWHTYVRADPEMTMSGLAEVALPDGGMLRYENSGLAEWRNAGKEKVWFDYRNGRVVVKSPDEEIIGKMVSIAIALGAKVQGDDGEIYPLNSKSLSRFLKMPDSRFDLSSNIFLRWPIWRLLILGFLLGSTLLALGLLLL